MAVKVSVVVAVYNRAKCRPADHLARCPVVPGDELKVVFVDDGSNDGTSDRLRAFSARRPNLTVTTIPNSGGRGDRATSAPTWPAASTSSSPTRTTSFRADVRPGTANAPLQRMCTARTALSFVRLVPIRSRAATLATGASSTAMKTSSPTNDCSRGLSRTGGDLSRRSWAFKWPDRARRHSSRFFCTSGYSFVLSAPGAGGAGTQISK